MNEPPNICILIAMTYPTQLYQWCIDQQHVAVQWAQLPSHARSNTVSSHNYTS